MVCVFQHAPPVVIYNTIHHVRTGACAVYTLREVSPTFVRSSQPTTQEGPCHVLAPLTNCAHFCSCCTQTEETYHVHTHTSCLTQWHLAPSLAVKGEHPAALMRNHIHTPTGRLVLSLTLALQGRGCSHDALTHQQHQANNVKSYPYRGHGPGVLMHGLVQGFCLDAPLPLEEIRFPR